MAVDCRNAAAFHKALRDMRATDDARGRYGPNLEAFSTREERDFKQAVCGVGGGAEQVGERVGARFELPGEAAQFGLDGGGRDRRANGASSSGRSRWPRRHTLR
jgi:hypothetical protein